MRERNWKYRSERSCEDGRWVELAQDHFHWRVLALAGSAIGGLIILLSRYSSSWLQLFCDAQWLTI